MYIMVRIVCLALNINGIQLIDDALFYTIARFL